MTCQRMRKLKLLYIQVDLISNFTQMRPNQTINSGQSSHQHFEGDESITSLVNMKPKMGQRLRLHVFVLACVLHTIHGAGITNQFGAPLEQPPECERGHCTLVFEAVQYDGPRSSFSTRGYNGQIPGPTIRVAAGETVLVTVINDLKDIGWSNTWY